MTMSETRAGDREPSQRLYVPVPNTSADSVQPAKRPPSFKGLRVGFLGNLKSNCDVLMHAAEEQMLMLGAESTLYREKESASLGATAALLDELAANCEVAVVGLGN